MAAEQQQFPEKKGTIDQLITKEEDVQRVLEGKKTAVRRGARQADLGETFELGGRTFEVHNMYEQALGEMTDEHAKSEGFDTMETYKNYILSLHPGMPWVPQMKMFVHEFREVK